ncbi:hypothetical protein BGW42_004467 [Actinomortierella wolfii]|nr:hypothetical protein BGW42_004467 [Actinomortierella wolfii]
MTRFATTTALGVAAFALSTLVTSAEAWTVDDVRSSLASGLLPFVTSPARTLEARSLYKRYEVCGVVGGTTYYCSSGSCVGLYRCTRGFNYAWIAAIVGAIFFCSLLGWWMRRRSMNRAHAAASNTEPVVTVVNPAPDPNQPQPYGQYVAPQPGQWAPPKDDPNLAYQTPATYPPPAPGATPNYSAYPPTSGAPAYPAPAASPYAQPAPYGAPPAVSGAPPAAYPPAPGASPYAQPAPYPVPGESSTYAPPKP